MDSLSQFLLTLFSILLPLFFSMYFYRLKRANSNRYSVPQAGGAWPIIGHMHLFGSQQLTHKTLGAMASAYGLAFTIKIGSHSILVVSSSEVVRECYTKHNRVFSTRPSTAASKLLGYDYAMFGFAPYGPYRRDIWKITTVELLASHWIDMLRHTRASELKVALRELYNIWTSKGNVESGALVDMKQWFGDLTHNMALKMVGGKRYFGASADCEEGEARRCQKLTRDFFHLFGVFVLSDAIPLLGWLGLVINSGQLPLCTPTTHKLFDT